MTHHFMPLNFMTLTIRRYLKALYHDTVPEKQFLYKYSMKSQPVFRGAFRLWFTKMLISNQRFCYGRTSTLLPKLIKLSA